MTPESPTIIASLMAEAFLLASIGACVIVMAIAAPCLR